MNASKALRPVLKMFRFDKKRDLTFGAPRVETAYVFAHGFIFGDVGIYGAPVAVLPGYEQVSNPDQSRRTAAPVSIRLAAKSGAFVTGRLIELTVDELARLDSLIERCQEDYHRFQAEVILPSNGHKTLAWVFQKVSDARLPEQVTSAHKGLIPDGHGALRSTELAAA